MDATDCYLFDQGTILRYDTSCGTDPIVPDMINGIPVTTIGSAAFRGMNLTSIQLPQYLEVL